MNYDFRPPKAPRSLSRIQWDVVGALIMREIHTRFGRANIGLLWLIVEPMMLAIAVTVIHYSASGHTDNGVSPAAFSIVGYTPFMLFRSIIGRAESMVEANRSLLYHRWVTLLDMMVARAAIEFAAVTFAVFLLLFLATAIGIADLPSDPLAFICALLLLLWFSFSLGLIVAAGSARSGLFGRLVHPFLYLSLPLSGAFYSVAWLPGKARDIVTWIPLTHIFEMLRYAEFPSYPNTYANPGYVVLWCLPLTLIGLLSLSVIRRHIELH